MSLPVPPMAAFLKTADRWLDRLYGFCGALAALLLVALAGLIVTSILARLGDFYISGLNDYAGYTLAGTSFLAFAYTFREKGHIRVAILLTNVPPRFRMALQIWCLIVASVFSGWFAYFIVKLAYVSFLLGDKSESADATPLWIPQSLMAFGAVVLAICVVHNAVKFLIVRDETQVPGAQIGSGEA